MLQASGNAEAVALLERSLAMARQGHIGYAAVTMLERRRAVAASAGTLEHEERALDAIDRLKDQIGAAVTNRTLPPRDEALGADHVCYNVPAGPCSYDFLVWLVDAEMTRRREGAPAPLKVAFWFGRDGKTGMDLPSRRQMFVGVMHPALALVGAVETHNTLGHCKELYTTRDIVAAARAGETVPMLLSPYGTEFNTGFNNPVTITLREAEHWPHRNSNADWIQFARYLKSRGEHVVFVRDTALADMVMPGFDSCALASQRLHDRAALYQSAKANLFVSNGPAVLATFADRPWLQFINLMPDGHVYHPDTPAFWREHMGIEPGGQYPWSRPDQRIVWAPDTYENLIEAWETHLAR